MSGSRLLALPETERPPNGANAELRWCDWIAWSLLNAKQIPAFNSFAPIEERDAVLGETKLMLER